MKSLKKLSMNGPRGFTVVELLVSMVIALVLMAGVMSVFISTSDSYRKLQGLASIQERGRIAIDMLQGSVQVAGYTGCRKDVTINNVLSNNAVYPRNFTFNIQGFDATATANTWSPPMDPYVSSPLWNGGDVVTVRGPIGTGRGLTAAMANVNDTLAVPQKSPFISGDLIMVVDCQGGADIFEKTNAGGATVTTIAHAAGGRNSTPTLGSAYGAGAMAVRVATTSFFIRDNGGVRALWIQEDEDAAQVLVEGVEAMQILYGVTTNTDTSANQYLTADQVNAAGWWNKVVSVRIALLVVSLEPTRRAVSNDTYTLLNVAYPAFNDYRQRRVFTTTITLRNRSF